MIEGMNLLQGRMKGSYLIKNVSLQNKAMQRRLEMLGFIQRTQLEILNKKSNGTMIIKMRGTRFAISGIIAAGIEVEVIPNGK